MGKSYNTTVPKIDLNYKPLVFFDGKAPEYNFINFAQDGIGIQIKQPDGYRTFLSDGLGYCYYQERAQMTGNDDWVADRIVELEKLNDVYK